MERKTDPSQNYLEKKEHPLHPFFYPKSVAIIGAKDQEGSVGRTVMANMIASFKGEIYPINPKYPEVQGRKTYPKVIPVDLAVIVVPPKLIPDIIDECAEVGVKSVIIISAGFKETGKEGQALELEVLQRAKKGGIRIVGPNCLGIMNPINGLNATFAAGIGKPGNIAFLSQSGALCTAVLDWSLKENIGFSGFVSVGSMADISWSDLIDYFGNDSATSSLLIYMETIGDARAFLSAAKAVTFNKPIIVIKPGRTSAAAVAAASHTGSLVGADDVFDMAIRRVGVLRVETIEQLFNMADVLSKQPHPKGNRLAIVTNAGGPAVLATDATILNGARLAELDSKTVDALNVFLPSAWSHNNPVDILGDGDANRYGKAIEVVIKDPNVDGLVVILTPQDMTDPVGTAEIFSKIKSEKPLLASWMGASFVEEGKKILGRLKIPDFSYPDAACATFALMWKQADYVKLLYETPALLDNPEEKHEVKIFEVLRKENRTLLTEAESKELLSAYGIPVVQTFIAKSVDEAVAIAEKIGYPVVLKLHSKTVTHKSDVGGVKLDIKNKEGIAVCYKEIELCVAKKDFEGVSVQKMVKMKGGYELILGSMVDPQFGPVVLFGSGGILVEIFKDRAIGLPPFTATLARRLMARTKIYEALKGVRGQKGVDLEKLDQIMIRFSRMVAEQARIKECDINPIIASDEGIIALDARIVLHDFSIPDSKLPKPAIRPYPIEYVFKENGLILRPLRPEDEPLLVDFHQELSAETVRARYFEFMSLSERASHERLIQICNCDYDREITLAAEVEGKIVAIGRLSKSHGESELKMTVIDRVQRKGIGRKLLTKLFSKMVRKKGYKK